MCAANSPSGYAECWGDGSEGQIGDWDYLLRSFPTALYGLTGPEQIAVGNDTACAIKSGAAYCWGSNWKGQQGSGDYNYYSYPYPVSGLSSNVTQIAPSARGYTTCAVVNGGAKCWGDNQYGQIGNGTITELQSQAPRLSRGSERLPGSQKLLPVILIPARWLMTPLSAGETMESAS